MKDKAMTLTLRKGPQWKPRWFVLKDGILWKYDNKVKDEYNTQIMLIKGDPTPSSKFPLYRCILEEYNPENSENSNHQFQISTKQRSMILRAHTEEEMHDWLNSILKQKILVEQTIDSILIILNVYLLVLQYLYSLLARYFYISQSSSSCQLL
jgi:hypothetical protein